MSFEVRVCPSLHLDRRSTELPNGKAVKQRRLPRIVASSEKRDAWMKNESDIVKLLEAMKRDF
jgi:hypothetical protein